MLTSNTLTLPPAGSALSPYVKDLISVRTGSQSRDISVLTERHLIDFDYISSKLPVAEDTQSYFRESVETISPMIEHVQDILQGHTVEQFSHLYHRYLQWTGLSELFVKNFEFLLSQSDSDDITALLVASAALERALGDVYLMSGAKVCPSMLKDLLVTPELRDMLGANVVQVLRLLIGPPISLSLRNVSWHGFPHPGEIPRRCIWFLLLVVPSLGRVLEERSVDWSRIVHREPAAFPQATKLLEALIGPDSVSDEVQQTLPSYPHSSQFMAWKTESFWEVVQGHYKHGRYAHCAGLLLYMLEQGLRRVFATANNCPARILTAESTTLYTTFDEILDRTLPDKAENKLLDVLGEPLMDVLFDTLVHPDGPRVRDRLSHGEADWNMFPWQLTYSLSVTCVLLSAMFVPQESQHNNQSPDAQRLWRAVQNYESRFHKISVIKQQIRNLFERTAKLDGIQQYTLELKPRTDCDTTTLNSKMNLPQTSQIRSLAVTLVTSVLTGWKQNADTIIQKLFGDSADGSMVCTEILHEKIRTVYRGKLVQTTGTPVYGPEREIEVRGLLHHVIEECVTVAKQLYNTILHRQQLLRNKQLRSRQRDNLKKLYGSCHGITLQLHLCSVLVAWQLYHLEITHTEDETKLKNRIRCWKQILQYCENLHTYTSSDKNKWTESLDLGVMICEKLCTSVKTHLLGTS